MNCPFCHKENTRVVDSRLVSDGSKIRRRRLCEACKRRFTTYEMIEESFPMLVKSDGRREAFNAAKVRAGINRAIENYCLYRRPAARHGGKGNSRQTNRRMDYGAPYRYRRSRLCPLCLGLPLVSGCQCLSKRN